MAVGEGGGGIGDGGAPLRYSLTSRGYVAFSPWNHNSYKYSLLQINLGANFISRLEVVSSLNILSQGRFMYGYDSGIIERHNPKIYLGTTLQTIAQDWIMDQKSTPSGVGQQTQKQKIY